MSTVTLVPVEEDFRDIEEDEQEEELSAASLPSDVEKWIANANEVTDIHLVHPTKSTDVASFGPGFTYPFFGNDEVIFGYKDLDINMRFSADDMTPNIHCTYSAKYKGSKAIKPTNIARTLARYLPKDAWQAKEDYLSTLQQKTAFVPPGGVIHSYTREEQTFQIWKSSLSDPEARRIVGNMGVLVPMFIEGGVPIDLDHPDEVLQRWKLFLIYRVTNDTEYSLVGFSTSYRLWYLQERSTSASGAEAAPQIDPNALDELFSNADYTFDILKTPSRERISQFLILPPYQNQSHGSHLYNTMVDTFLADPDCHEITVEDPNEAFDELRDYSDMARLRQTDVLSALHINTKIAPEDVRSTAIVPLKTLLPQDTLTTIRTTAKISPRQFNRLIEMHLLSQIPPLNRSTSRITQRWKTSNEKDRTYYWWRIIVKARLYVQNRDLLAQLDLEERVEKLEETIQGVQEEYEKLLEVIERRERVRKGLPAEDGDKNGRSGVDEGEESTKISVGRVKGKKGAKRIVEEDDEDEEEEQAEPVKSKPGPRKKVRIADPEE